MVKKILYILLGLIIVLGLAVFIIAKMNPTFSDTVSVEVNAPVNKTWAIFDDDDSLGKWLEGFKSAELVEGEHKTVGSKYNMTFEHDGKEFSMVETITAFEPEEKFGFALDNDFANFDVLVSFSETDGTTTITEEMTGGAKSMIGKAMMAMTTTRMHEDKTKMYERLADLIEESDWTPPQPEPLPTDTMQVDSISN